MTRLESKPRKIVVLGINGSPGTRGRVRCVSLLKKVLRAAQIKGARTSLIHLKRYEQNLFKLSDETDPPSQIKFLFTRIISADAVVLATPVHWFGVSGVMKTFLEYLTYLEGSENFALEGKVVAFIATCNTDGGMKTVLDMAGPLNHMGALIPPYGMFFFNGKLAKNSEKAWMLNDPKLIGENVVRLATVCKGKSWS